MQEFVVDANVLISILISGKASYKLILSFLDLFTPDFALALIKATELARDIDIKDVSYIALAIQLDLILLTRDKKLLQGLKRKGFRKVMLFEDLLSSF